MRSLRYQKKRAKWMERKYPGKWIRFFSNFGGKRSIPQALKIQHNFRVLIEGSIKKEGIEDDEKGGFEHEFIFEPVKVEAITELGETIQAKDTRSNSKLWHGSVWAAWKENDHGLDSEAFYNIVCSWERRNRDAIVEEAMKEYEKQK